MSTEYMLPAASHSPNGQHVVRDWRSPASDDEWYFTGTDATLTTLQIVALYSHIDPVLRQALLEMFEPRKAAVDAQGSTPSPRRGRKPKKRSNRRF